MYQILKKTSEIYGHQSDQNHIHTVVEMNPKVPDRNKSLNGTGEDCGPALNLMARNLVQAKVDFVVCACNTAHAYSKSIEEGCGKTVPFVSMIDVTTKRVRENIEA